MSAVDGEEEALKTAVTAETVNTRSMHGIFLLTTETITTMVKGQHHGLLPLQ
jgi:hypothetical protein